MAQKTIAERFWSKVDKSGECWLWTACLNETGYGMVYFEGRARRAHRVSWVLTYGAVPAGACVLHRCDTPACVNPAHLWLGTLAENTADMLAKGRASTGALHAMRKRKTQARGERQGHAKLTTDQVVAIRADTRLMRLIAADYGVCLSVICEIRQRKSWSHVP